MKKDIFTLDEDTIKFQTELNQTIWDGETLKEEVSLKLMDIANAFVLYLDVDIKILDIQFTGSLANYNYHDLSDVDLHIVTDYADLDVDMDMISSFFNAKKSLFNQNHDISIYGFPVELYVEDVNMPAKSSGVYSVLNDKWIKKPDLIEDEVEDVIDTPKFLEIVDRINTILSSEFNSEEAESYLENLYTQRKESLAEAGEIGEFNLIFKALRNDGLLQALRDYIRANFDKSLSLDW